MKSVGAFDAQANLSKLLEQVVRGESFLITEQGKPIASLSPVSTGAKLDFKKIVTDFREQYQTASKGITLTDILEFRSAGRK